jgi:general secretion pathway protein G
MMIASGGKHRRRPGRDRGGFTLVELLMVVVILAILVALLLPAINAAVRTARQAAVQAEITQLAAALESFKSKYGDYPPSRVILYENGLFNVNSPTPIPGENISEGNLAQQSLSALQKFFPKVIFGTSVVPYPVVKGNGNFWYDFNGNGVFDQTAYILHGHECLVFFLGGIPLSTPTWNAANTPPLPLNATFGMTGFGNDPTNPFSNSVNNGNAMFRSNRQAPIFEFNAGRLFLDPNNQTNNGYLANNGVTPGIPGYYDSLGNAAPGTGTTNFYAYFSAYGNGAYNPDDVNFAGPAYMEDSGAPIGLQFVPYNNSLAANPISPAPNPYTTTPTANNPVNTLPSGTVTYQKAQTYQIISPGADGLYGVGGTFLSSTAASTSAANTLPFDPNNTYAGGALATDSSIRSRERDNLTNFKGGSLQ